ncbi:hypothetical protein ACK3TF_000456 [Chlorella vulgaris]
MRDQLSFLTDEEVQRAEGYYGTANRMRRVAAKLLAGTPVQALTGVLSGVAGTDPASGLPLHFPELELFETHPRHTADQLSFLTDEEVQRAEGYYGTANRMRRVAAKLLAGTPVQALTGVLSGVAGTDPASGLPLHFPELELFETHPRHTADQLSFLTDEEVQRAEGYYGTANRMRRVAAKLLAGTPVQGCLSFRLWITCKYHAHPQNPFKLVCLPKFEVLNAASAVTW